MDTPLLDDQDRLSTTEDDAQSYMDEDDVREVRLYHWLSETAGVRSMQDSALTRADSPLLGFDHHLTQAHDLKPLPDLPPTISRLRSQSQSHPLATPIRHRCSPSLSLSLHSTHSQSPSPSRRPSLARKPSLPLLSESAPLPVTPPPRRSSRMHSISSSLSIGSNRNAVYIDSEQVSSRLDEWLISRTQHDHQVQDLTSYQDSSAVASLTPAYAQGPPPNTPMTGYYNTPHASSSQIYLGKTLSTDAQDPNAGSINTDQEDVRATPVPHGRLVGPDLAISGSTSSDSSHGSPVFSAATLSTSPTSAGVSSCSIVPSQSSPATLASKPSLTSISMALLSPKPSLTSIGLAYQNQLSTDKGNTLSPPPATASRWSLTSSIAGDAEKDKKKKEKGATRKRLASFISKISGSSTTKETKDGLDVPIPNPEQVRTRERSLTDSSLPENILLPPAKIKSKSKPPSLKLGPLANSHSVSNLRSPTLSSKPSLSSLSVPFSPSRGSMTNSTPTPTFPPSIVASPVSTSFAPISPVKKSFTSTRLSVSTTMTTTSTNTASPLMPNTPIFNDAPLPSPALKNAVSVPALSPAWEGPGLLRRDNSYGWSSTSSYFGETAPTSPTSGYDDEDDDLEEDAEYYVRESVVAQKALLEQERKARLSLIADMLDRDVNAPPQPKVKVVSSSPQNRDSVDNKTKSRVKVDAPEPPVHSNPASPAHYRKSSSSSRTSSLLPRRSVSGPTPILPMISTPPPMPSKTGFRNLAVRMGISNSLSTPQSPPSPETESKRKSIVNLMSNGKRKGQKRRLVIRGVGECQKDVEALKEWCSSLGEVRSMVKVKNVESVVTQIGRGEGSGRTAWVVDFKKSSVAESACRLQAKVEIKGAGSVDLSWETTKPKLRFNVGKMGWTP